METEELKVFGSRNALLSLLRVFYRWKGRKEELIKSLVIIELFEYKL